MGRDARVWFHATAATDRPARQAIRQVDFSIRADGWNGAAVPLPDTASDGTYRFIARVGYEVDGLETPELFGVIERKHGVWQRANGPVRSETPAGGDFID